MSRRSMPRETREEKVDRLLHDADRNAAAAAFALRMRDQEHAETLSVRARELAEEARRLDPKFECEGWEWIEPSPELQRCAPDVLDAYRTARQEAARG